MDQHTRTSWRRLGQLLRPRATLGNVLAGVLALLLGTAVVVQVQATDAGGLEDLREADLVALLDDVTQRADDLETEVADLARQRDLLQGAQGDQAALAAAQERLDSYRILAGTVPVTGPGISMLIQDPAFDFEASMMLDMVQELRNAGAEAIQVSGVRLVAGSWIGTDGQTLLVDGTAVAPPYSVVAVGDPHTLSGAMAIPGGFNDAVNRVGGSVTVTEGDTVTVDALHEATAPRYARPVPSQGD